MKFNVGSLIMTMKTVYSVALFCSVFATNLANALPTGGQVAAGSANISQSGSTTTITQSTPSAVINWKGFDTTSGETVNFHQPDQNSVILNRIISGQPTNFAGNLYANGKVFIVNSAGMVFTKGSSINAASILATTDDIKDADFMQGNYKFFNQPGHENASIINNGVMTVTGSAEPFVSGVLGKDAGFIALIAPNVINGETGIIQADYSRVILGAGQRFVLDFNSDQLINFDASAAVAQGYIKNAGVITAKQGVVYLMTPRTVGQVLNTLTSNAGVKEASTVVINSKNKNEISLAAEEPKRGSIINTGNIKASNITLFAASDVSIDGPITVSSFLGPFGYLVDTLRVTSLTGNIAINAPINGVYDVVLHGNTINESKAGYITAPQLYMISANGANMIGENAISDFWDIKNTQSGGVYFRNYSWHAVDYFNLASPNIAGGYKEESINFWEYYFGGN